MADFDPDLLGLIPAAPLLAAVLIAAFGPLGLRGQSHWPCVLGIAASCGLSVWLLLSGPLGMRTTAYEWLNTGGLVLNVTLKADALAAVMLVTVTFVSLLVAIYSIGYMHGDSGYPRFFAVFSLFVFSMTGLVLANNFLLLYVFWEGVGLCSYLLIGYWFHRPSAAAAAKKAFLVNRVGDFGFALGIFLIWITFNSLDYDAVFTLGGIPGYAEHGTLLLICLLLFLGAAGKSAQFPLHVWLPDAMEGPTPVSALIHAATMVTAGVYLVARCSPLFVQAPEAQLVVAVIGGFTALLAALIALTQFDLKRVLAYSTVSQLGLMFLALGTPGAFSDPAQRQAFMTFAVIAAIFHLFTHAFFKALLFLGAGSVMHAMGDVIDMRRFGGLRGALKRTHATFLCGALALAGFPLLSGFWSKDEILAASHHATHGDQFTAVFWVLTSLGLVTALLTAFYTFRAYFLTFWGEERFPPEAGEHPHESPPVMLGPLIVLAVGAVAAGVLFGPTHVFGGYVQESAYLADPGAYEIDWTMLVAGSVLALMGMVAAYWRYVARRPEALASPLAAQRPWWYELSANRFYLDEIYTLLIVWPVRGVAAICRVLDQYLLDGIVDLIGWIPALLGKLFRPVQNGLVQFYALAMVLGLAVFVIALVVRALGG